LASAECYGIIVDVKTFSRTNNEKEDIFEIECKRRIKRTNEEFHTQADMIRDDLRETFSSILLREKFHCTLLKTLLGK
jgi:hypothetical protein